MGKDKSDRYYLFSLKEIPKEFHQDFLNDRWQHNCRYLRVASIISILAGAILALRRLLDSASPGGAEMHWSYMINYLVLMSVSIIYLVISTLWRNGTYKKYKEYLQRFFAVVLIINYSFLTYLDLQIAADFSAFSVLIVFMSVILWIDIFSFLAVLALADVLVAMSTVFGVHPSVSTAEVIVQILIFTFIGIGLFFTLSEMRMRHFASDRLLNNTVRELKEMSLRDPLTKLYNRRMMNEELEKELALSRRTGFPLTLILIDLDHFKKVNDNLGHSQGDEVLKESSTRLLAAVRESDRVYRFGGEELVIMLPNTDIDSAEVLAERVRRIFCDELFDGVPWPVTVSMGLADNTERLLSSDLIKLADTRMYEAKADGRNRFVGRGNQDTQESEDPVIP